MTLHRATGRLPALAHCVAALKGTQDLTNGGESVFRPEPTPDFRMMIRSQSSQPIPRG
jgi:hypothetical protein